MVRVLVKARATAQCGTSFSRSGRENPRSLLSTRPELSGIWIYGGLSCPSQRGEAKRAARGIDVRPCLWICPSWSSCRPLRYLLKRSLKKLTFKVETQTRIKAMTQQAYFRQDSRHTASGFTGFQRLCDGSVGIAAAGGESDTG